MSKGEAMTWTLPLGSRRYVGVQRPANLQDGLLLDHYELNQLQLPPCSCPFVIHAKPFL